MPDWTILSVGKIRRICMFGILLFAVPEFVFSQECSSSNRPPSNDEYPFAGVDDSLTRAANNLLASPTPAPIPAPVMSSPQQAEPQSRPVGGSAPGSAMMRLNDLRPIVEPILMNRGVPADLAAVIVVESGGRADALSPKGARGLWQLMPDTARRYGLRVDENRDERLDLFKSTDAAAQYLHDLYAQFGDWKLALAAYNTGESNVSSAILRTHAQSFEQLVNLRAIPLETRNYVPRVLVAASPRGWPSDQDPGYGSMVSVTVFAVSSH